jgi:mannose-1-phosphate guanylyltransferase
MAESESRRPPALLLSAGLGTRLQPLTYLRAKAAVPINGAPLVVRAIRALAGAGVRDLVLNLHHKPASIAALVGDGVDLGVRVRYSWEQPVLGSAGGPRHALPLLTDADDDDFLIANADTLTDVDIPALLSRHRQSGALVTMALIRNPRPDFYGGVLVSSDGWVTGFSPRRKAASGADTIGEDAHHDHAYHFIGVQVAQARVFRDLEDGVPCESVGALYPRLMAAQPQAIAAFISKASFLDIGTPLDCLETSLALAEREGPRLIGSRATIDPSAELIGSTVWDDVTIGAHASLRACIVGDGATISAGARFERCAIVPATGREPAAGERLEAGLIVRPL